jgi:hypothetical protein
MGGFLRFVYRCYGAGMRWNHCSTGLVDFLRDIMRRLHEWLTPRGLLILIIFSAMQKVWLPCKGVTSAAMCSPLSGEHFDVLEGVLDPESSMGITVARKRIS